MGFLSAEQLHRLHEAGVTSYHHNIETSRRNFPNICTTHTYDMKIETLKKVKAEGMCACSGGIIGMGETWEDRLDMAISLAELGIDSIPINALMPIPGTPLENLPRLSEADILRTIAFFRYINPDANIRLAAGRALLTNDGEIAFQSGASASITGNMLTTVACATIRSDRRLLEDLGRDVTPEYWKEEKKDAAVARLLGTGSIDPHAASLSGQRQLSAALRARDAVAGALDAAVGGFGLDAVSVCVDDALDALCDLTGENASEAVIEQVFERFCVGK